MKYVSVFCYLLCILPTVAYAQQSALYFKNYQVSAGLSSNTVTSIVQDRKGFMWFGTRNGLSRFDGTHFKTYRAIPDDSLSLGNNSILSLYEDKYERLWVGTYTGVYRYNPVDESFIRIRSIPRAEVRFIYGDGDEVWLVADGSVYRSSLSSGKTQRCVLRHEEVTALYHSPEGNFWIGSNAGQLIRYSPQEDQFSHYPTGSGPINALSTVGDSIVLIGALQQSFSYAIKQQDLQAIFHDRAPGNTQTHSIFQVDSSTYWFGTENGIFIYCLPDRSTQLVHKEPSQLHALTNNTISAIYQDTEGGIWVGTYFGGLNYYNDQYNRFEKYYPQHNRNSISGDIVHEICKDQYDNLWIGTEDAGLNCFDKKRGTFSHYLPSPGSSGISYHNIHGLLAVGDELWIGTYEHGLDVMHIPSRKIIRHYNTAMPNNFGSNFIICLYQTQAGDILVGTWSGLYRYRRDHDDFEQLPFFEGHIQSITEDRKGTLWVATYGQGVYYENKAAGTSGHFQHQEKENSLINDYVNHVYEDQEGDLWFCTEGGLSRFEVNSGIFLSYSSTKSLSDNQVFRIAQDNTGVFWISTANGLNKLHGDKGTFEHYHTAHGLPTEQFNYNSSFQDKDGTLYFGTVKGMIRFQPEQFTANPFVPPLFITGIEINNQPLELRKDHILSHSILYTDSLALPYDQANVNFDVAALSYGIPEKNRYRYRMEGIDKEWVSLADNRKIYYTKLAPGDYLFRLKAANSDGVWNPAERQLFIRITPPFWATGFAYTLYILLCLGIIFIIFRYYSLALRAKEKERMQSFEMSKEREVYHAKIDFFTNVAHEIRTPLTLIKMPLEKLLKSLSENQQAQQNLVMIEKNTDRLIDLTNQLLDFRKAEANNFSLNFAKTDINELLQQEFNQFIPAAEEKGLNYQLKLPRITLHAFVDAQAMKKIIGNLISNAIKYAHSQIQIALLPFASEDLYFHMEFRNDGLLIPENEREKIFEPFYRSKDSGKTPGTGIGLPLARALAELHQGKLESHGHDDLQNVFVLAIPIHQDYELEIVKADEQEEEAADPENEMISSRLNLPVILLVEDNTEILQYLAKELSASYRVIKSRHGQEALDVLNSEAVHLIISDIMMPLLDGISFTRIVKTDVRFSHIPLILLTAKNSLQSKIEGLETGADAYIEKPFSFDFLSAQISNLLSSRDQLKAYFAHSPLSHIKGMAYSKTDQDFLEKLNHVIYENITDTNLDVEKLSALMHMSRPTLYRKIKGISDMTPNELINITRLKRAAELLAEGQYKINEVAYMIGYSVPTNFSRDFQRQFGMSPSTYIQQLKDT